MDMGKLCVAVCVWLGFAVPISAQTTTSDSVGVDIKHTSKGFQFTTPDNKFQLQIAGRLQFRYAFSSDQDPLTFDDYSAPNQHVFKINRARLKVGGHAYQPWLKYYFEYELGASRLLDFRVMVEKWPWLSFKVGQWKMEYTRERSISSGKQQMLERSLINRPFTIDRQQGASIYGRIDEGGLVDFNYHLAALTGMGRGARENDDKKLMYVGKVFWNFLGDGPSISGTDLSYHEKPQASIALAGATNTSPYTRFSSSGGGELLGYEGGEPGQYNVDQWVLETALKYKAFSWQSEYHRKRINDRLSEDTGHLAGFYLQGGYVVNNGAVGTRKPLLEVAGRYAYYQPELSLPDNSEEEYTLAVNCFFNGHLNKLTADVTLFDFDDMSLNLEANDWRVRVQYDFSF
ncbi:porin [Echinicola strongylocentroti]|uniref:Porin n=2 Tax=Echinicola strongylocentroti TaxID=1795355 RepID=A0A2Z4IQT1_9BACT|nr:porin [Echinicola strongylocentroti]